VEEAERGRETKETAGPPRQNPLPDPCLATGVRLLAAASVRDQGRIRSLADPSPEPSRAFPCCRSVPWLSPEPILRWTKSKSIQQPDPYGFIHLRSPNNAQ